jgi:hypothetical protein
MHTQGLHQLFVSACMGIWVASSTHPLVSFFLSSFFALPIASSYIVHPSYPRIYSYHHILYLSIPPTHILCIPDSTYHSFSLRRTNIAADGVLGCAVCEIALLLELMAGWMVLCWCPVVFKAGGDDNSTTKTRTCCSPFYSLSPPCDLRVHTYHRCRGPPSLSSPPQLYS